MQRLVAISPHFDDVCFSVGHLVRRVTACEKILVNIFTRSDDVCNIPTIDRLSGIEGSQRIETISRLRDEEDSAYARALGFRKIDCGFADADIVARTEKDPGHHYAGIDEETEAVTNCMRGLLGEFARAGDAIVLCPLAIGQHRNHLVAFAATLACVPPRIPIVFYEDLPYSVDDAERRKRLAGLHAFLTGRGYGRHALMLSQEDLMEKYADARHYLSQMSDSNQHFVLRTPECPHMHEAVWSQEAGALMRLVGQADGC
jgi:hypothetical protein